jgi:hypothetical protein
MHACFGVVPGSARSRIKGALTEVKMINSVDDKAMEEARQEAQRLLSTHKRGWALILKSLLGAHDAGRNAGLDEAVAIIDKMRPEEFILKMNILVLKTNEKNE